MTSWQLTAVRCHEPVSPHTEGVCTDIGPVIPLYKVCIILPSWLHFFSNIKSVILVNSKVCKWKQNVDRQATLTRHRHISQTLRHAVSHLAKVLDRGGQEDGDGTARNAFLPSDTPGMTGDGTDAVAVPGPMPLSDLSASSDRRSLPSQTRTESK